MNNSILKLAGTFVFLVAVSILSETAATSQITRVWDDSNGGIFDVSSSWTPTGIPGQLDTARFVFIQPDSIPVTFFEDENINTLEINGGRYRFAGAGQFGTGPLALMTNNLTMENNGNLLMQDGLDHRSFHLNVTNEFDIAGRIVIGEGTRLTTLDATLDSIISNSPGEIALVGFNPSGAQSTWNGRTVTIGESRFGSLIANSGSMVFLENVTMASETGGSGEIDLSGKGFNGNPTSASISNLMIVGQSGDGLIEVRDGAELTSRTAFIAAEAESTGAIILSGNTFDHKGTFINGGNVYVGGNNVQPGGIGELQILARGTALIGQTLKIWDNGSVRLDSQGTLTADAIDNNQGGEFNFFGGTLAVNQFEGDLVNQGGTLLPGGNEPGSTFILGSYTQQAGTKLIVDIGGNNPGVDHDLVNMSGVAFLDGSLGIAMEPGFQPQPSDQFTILAASDVLGFFDDAVNGQRKDTTNGEGSFIVNYGLGSAFDSSLIVLTDYRSNVILGDVNEDGFVDLLDVAPFVNAVTSGHFLSAADINQDGMVDLLDIEPFINLLTGS